MHSDLHVLALHHVRSTVAVIRLLGRHLPYGSFLGKVWINLCRGLLILDLEGVRGVVHLGFVLVGLVEDVLNQS